MTLLEFILFLVGFGLLVLGAELLVRGSSSLASALGISPLIIGLTIVAYGTSAPELAVSIKAGLAGQPDLALGNVVGSNIFNVLFVLGLSAAICPLVVSQQLVVLDVPILIGLSLLLLGMVVFDGTVSRVDGLILVAGMIGYTLLQVRIAKREKPDIQAEYAQHYGAKNTTKPGPARLALFVGYCIVGLGLLVLGTHWFVNGAVAIAAALGVSELVIGLTIVAAGTSMPEVFTSVVAAIKGERDIAVGNAVGSSIFNIIAILGIASVVTPGGLTAAPHLVAVDLPIMIGVAVACLPIFFTGHSIDRWEGVVLFAYYIFYTVYIILKSTGDTDWLPMFQSGMFLFVIPLTVITLVASAGHAWRRRGFPAA